MADAPPDPGADPSPPTDEPMQVDPAPADSPPPPAAASLPVHVEQSPADPPPPPPSAAPQPAADSPATLAASLALAQPLLVPGSGTPGSASLFESLFPSGSEGGSPPPPRRRPTRSPSREPSNATPDGTGPAAADGPSASGQQEENGQAVESEGPSSLAELPADSSLPAAAAAAAAATTPSVPGPSSHAHAHAPGHDHVHHRNASPGPSRSSPLPPTASTSVALAPPAAANGSASMSSAPAPAARAVPRLNLPVVSFRVVERPARPPTTTVAQSYGYNPAGPNGGPMPFVQPPHLMRSVDPIEADLMNQVEYDMDPQDYAWVARVNASYRRTPTEPVPTVLTDDFFTIALDRIEKEWWELTKRIPNPRSQMPSEEEACAICDDADGENSNAIVFCDGCNLAVHQDCYGVPYIPEGQWLCRKCTVSPENPVSCVMCPSEGGAFKQTTAGKWAHLLCAIWIPEAGVGNTVYMEPVDGVEMITKQRWKLKCSLCKKPGGACIQCENKSCYTAFHPTCAREAALLGSMKTYGDTGGVLKAYCERHIPHTLKTTNDAKRALYHSNHAKKTKKSARAHAKRYEVPPPLLPNLILNSVTDYVKRLPGPGARKRELVERIGRYWSLKREARRGAPLLKRLHLEPWTAADLANQKTEEERAMQLAYLSRTRQDLEQVRMLNNLVLKREKAKQRQAEAVLDVLRPILKPWEECMTDILDKLRDSDKRKFFHEPVDGEAFPEYYLAIAHPMSFQTIEDKIYDDQYLAFSEFEADVLLVCINAMTFNPPAHFVHKAALKTKEVALPLLAGMRAAVLAKSHIYQLLQPLRDEWAARHAHLGAGAPPFPVAEISRSALGDDHEPEDSLEAHPDVLAMLSEPLDDGSGDTFLQSLFDYRYELEPEPAPPADEASKAVAVNGKGKDRAEGRPTRIRVQPLAEQPVRQSSRKRARDASPSLPPPAALPSARQTIVLDADDEEEDPLVAEKRRLFTNFEQGTILPEGSRRRAAAYVPPRPINQALLAAQQDQQRKKKAPAQRREPKVIIPTSHVPSVKVPKRRPKSGQKNKVAAEAPPPGPAAAWTFDDDSDLSSLSSHASEVESESEPEPSDEVLQVEPRPVPVEPEPEQVHEISDDDDDDVREVTDDEIQEVVPPRRSHQRRPPPVDRFGAISPPSRTAFDSPASSSARRAPTTPSLPVAASPRKTRSSPAPPLVQDGRSKPPPKQSGLRQQITIDSDSEQSPAGDERAVDDVNDDDDDDDDGSLASLFEGSIGEEDAVEALTFADQGTSTRTMSRSRQAQPEGSRPTSTPTSTRDERRRGPPPPALALESVIKSRLRDEAASTPVSVTRARAIVNKEVPTTARSKKGAKTAPSQPEVQTTPAPAVAPRSSARRSSLAAAGPTKPPRAEQPVAPPPASKPRASQSSLAREAVAQSVASESDVEMDEAATAPSAEPSTTDVDMEADPAPARSSSARRTSQRMSRADSATADVGEQPEAGPSKRPAAKRRASTARASSPPPAEPSSEGEEQDAPAPKLAVKTPASRRTSLPRARKSLSAPEPALDADEAEEAPAATLFKAAKKRLALAQAAESAPDPSTTDSADLADPSVLPLPPDVAEGEQELDIKGRPKRHLKPPKRFLEDDVVPPLGPPPLKRQKPLKPVASDVEAGTADGDVKDSDVQGDGEGPPEDEAVRVEPPSGVWDDEEEEDPNWTHGTLVWAQCKGHPWYPAEVVVPIQIDHEDLDEEEIPADVHLQYKAARAKWLAAGGDPDGRPFLVHFFDKKRVWAHVHASQLHDLGDDHAHDEALLTHQTHKNFSKNRKDLFYSFEAAWKTIEPDLVDQNLLPAWFVALKNQPSKPSSKKDSRKTKAAKLKAALAGAADVVPDGAPAVVPAAEAGDEASLQDAPGDAPPTEDVAEPAPEAESSNAAAPPAAPPVDSPASLSAAPPSPAAPPAASASAPAPTTRATRGRASAASLRAPSPPAAASTSTVADGGRRTRSSIQGGATLEDDPME